MGEYLKQYVSKEKEWDEWLEFATFSYNTCVHEGTKYTPYELVFGKVARVPTNEPLHDLDRLATYDNYIIDLVKRLTNIRKLAYENLVVSKHKSKEYYDRKIKPTNFVEGDNVYLQKGPKPGKLGDHYDGPYQILEIFPNGNAKIQIKNKSKIVHPNRLRKSHIAVNEANKQLNKKKEKKVQDKDPDFKL